MIMLQRTKRAEMKWRMLKLCEVNEVNGFMDFGNEYCSVNLVDVVQYVASTTQPQQRNSLCPT